MAAEREVLVPDIGDFKDIEIIEVLVKPGDVIQVEDSIITLESDKAAMEVPAPFGGVVKSVQVKAGERVNKGSVILVLESHDAAVDAASLIPLAQASVTPPVVPDAPVQQSQPASSVPASVPVAGGDVRELDVTVPDIGDFKDIEIIEVLVRPGDVVQAEDSLITLESDKAAMEVPAPFGGTVKSVKVKPGDRVNKGSLILVLESVGAAPAMVASSPAPAPASPVIAQADPTRVPPHTAAAAITESTTGNGSFPSHASPAVRRFARELGVTLDRVRGTGPKHRILKQDVQQFVKNSLQQAEQRPAAVSAGGFAWPPMPAVDFSKYGPVESLALSRIQKLSGPNLHRNWVSIPHITQYDEADITELESFRQSLKKDADRRGVKLSFLPFVLKAVAASLKAYPTFNASLATDGESLILKRYFHVGVAVDTPDGLVVPVIRDVDQKSLFDLAEELAEVSQRARNKKLRGTDLEGGCFTISSLGGIGGTAFTPIINAPEVAILGLSKSQMKPVWQGEQFEPRLMLPLSLSYDHRVIDGAQGARFIVHLSSLLNDMRRILL